MVQSVLGAKNLEQGQKGANFTAWLKLLDIPLFILPGILCFILLPNLADSKDAYLNLVREVFPTGLIGLVVVVMIAALISTIGSALNSLSTVFTMDIYGKKFKPNATQDEYNKIGRFVTLVGAVLSVFLALAITQIQGLSFFNIFQSVLGFLAPPMTAAFLFSVFWKKATSRAINIILTAGTVFSLGTGLLYYTGLFLSDIHYLYISCGIFIVLAIAIILISLLAPEKVGEHAEISVMDTSDIQKPSKRVLLPWILLVVVMVIMYIIFNGN
jgi:SSS family solute:Na+ symporter